MKICIFTALLMVMNLEYLWIMAAAPLDYDISHFR